MQVQIPEISEGTERAAVARVLVSVGDHIDEEEPLLELEADKASFELPSPVSGTVEEIMVNEGDEVEVGQVALTIREGDEEPKASQEEPAAEEEEPPKAERKPRAKEDREDKEDEVEEEKPSTDEAAPDVEEQGPQTVRAAPSTRMLARELGVDLKDVARERQGERITGDDVKDHVRKTRAWSDDSRDATTVEPLSRLRRTAAKRLTQSWQTIPHVTQHELADITKLEAARAAYVERHPDLEKLTLTAILARALVAVLKAFPRFNASYDEKEQQLLINPHVHLGIAVDSDRGLLVPVLRDAHTLSLRELNHRIRKLADAARAGDLEPRQLLGSTFTLSNLGSLGGSFFTPIIQPDEVAILGVARARSGIYASGTNGAEQLLLPLSLSYDHRVIDGADAVRFLVLLVEMLNDPLVMLVDA
ncbi:MAG TPA: dihydrolipoamide acetyltransferase family protein [Polyangiaceae bacterium]|jgi:pyruvate dehydrogenase E2 component (dihydrolipoamide acetyltransferase)|nr:dihydrolipoamide acetyltransferase family protein [Polyangiaceae bacterium]